MEPAWVTHAIWWRIYPLGFVDAFPEPESGAARPEDHRLLRVVEWLDHAVELGASGIALGPIFESATHGYDTTDHFRIDPRLGEESDFDTLVAAAHRRGLRVQLDGVFNHLGEGHQLVQAARQNTADSAATRWFRRTQGPDGVVALDTFEGHDSLIALNHDEPKVQEYVIDVLRHWLDRGADSWRLDAAYTVAPAFWAKVLPTVRATHPDVWFEAEVLHGDYAEFVASSTADSVTQYELWKAIWSGIEDRNFWELDWAMQRHTEMLESFAPSTFIGNHDVTRIASRISDQRHLPHAIVLLALLGGTPTVYAGDEFGFRGVKEERFGGDDLIRPEFPIGGPGSLEDADRGLLGLYRLLLGVRRRNPWLHRAGSRTEHVANTQHVFTVSDGERSLRVALNLDDRPLARPSGNVLAADPTTATGGSDVAPHGWVVVD